MSTAPTFAVSILGGVPTSKDLAPSVLFCVAYAALGGLWAFRMHQCRSLLLLRPGIFILVRIVTLGIRAGMSQGNYSVALFIVDIILLTIGLILLLDPLIECFKSHIQPFSFNNVVVVDSTERATRNKLARVANLLRLGILGIIVTGVVAGAMSYSAISNPGGSASKTVDSLRLANYILGVVILAVLLLATSYAQRHYSAHLDQMKSFFIMGTVVLLLVPSSYKLATTNRSNPTGWIHSSAAFFLFLVVFEYIACLLLLIFPITQMFPSEKARKRQQDEEAARAIEMKTGQVGSSGEHLLVV